MYVCGKSRPAYVRANPPETQGANCSSLPAISAHTEAGSSRVDIGEGRAGDQNACQQARMMTSTVYRPGTDSAGLVQAESDHSVECVCLWNAFLAYRESGSEFLSL